MRDCGSSKPRPFERATVILFVNHDARERALRELKVLPSCFQIPIQEFVFLTHFTVSRAAEIFLSFQYKMRTLEVRQRNVTPKQFLSKLRKRISLVKLTLVIHTFL